MRGIKSEATCAVVTAIVSPIIASLVVFIDPVADWYLIQLACLAPIVSWLCVSHSCAETLLQCLLLLVGGVGGVLLGWFWLFIQVSFFEHSADGHHNHYLGVVLNFVWVALLTLPRIPMQFSRAQALAILCLYTLTIYGGGDANGETYGNPAKAGLSVLIGCASTALVTSLVWLSLARDQSHTVDVMRIRLRESLNLCLDAIQLIGSPLPVEKLNDAKADLYANIHEFLTFQPVVLQSHATTAADTLTALSSIILTCKDCAPISLEISRSLVNFRLTSNVNYLADLSEEIESADFKISAALRWAVFAATKIKRFEMAVALHSQKTPLMSEISRFRILPIIPEVDWRFSIKSTLLLTVLGVFIVAWDDHSSAVEAYAIWGLLPALLLMCRKKTVGSMLLRGASSFLSCLVGCGLGVVSASMNGSQSIAYLSQLALVLLVSSVCVFKLHYGAVSYVPICWVICGLAEWNDSTAGVKDLWLNAIFRNVIVCGSVLISIIAVTFLPEFSTFQREVIESATRDALLKAVEGSWDLEISSDQKAAMDYRLAALRKFTKISKLSAEVCLERFFTKPGNFLDLSELSETAGAVLAINSATRGTSALQSRAHAALSAACGDALRLEILEFSKAICRAKGDGVGDAEIIQAASLLNFLKCWLTVYEPGNLKRLESRANLL